MFTISLSALFSVASLLVILYRVSPITAPEFGIPFFFLTLLLSVASMGALLFYAIWSSLPIEGMDPGRKLTISLREGIFLSIATVLLILFHLLGILTWWIGVLIYFVFVLIETALHV